MAELGPASGCPDNWVTPPPKIIRAGSGLEYVVSYRIGETEELRI